MTAPVAELSIAYRPGPLTREQASELVACALSFRRFLAHWRFKDRETGEVRCFSADELWPGQAALIGEMERSRNLYALKAGKLGFTELECAYDGWVARYRQPNARVHLFSMGQESSRALLEIVRFGLDNLPEYMRLPVVEGEAEAATSTSLKLYAGPGDIRRVVSYPARQNASIDQTCTHAHCDEYARWPYGQQMWAAIRSTISPEGGSCHMISRGNGPNWAAKVYHQARRGELIGQDGTPFRSVFYPWDARPRPDEWRAQQEGKEADHGYIWQYAPETWQQALQGDSTYVYPMWENPPGRHLTPAHPCPLVDCKRVVITIDPGGTDPTALGLYGERSSGRVHKYAEWYQTAASDDDIEAVLVRWEDEAGRRVRIGVPKDEPTLYHTLRAHGFAVFWVSMDRDEGIRLVRQRLTTGGYTVHAGCSETAVEYEDYRVVSVTDATTKVVYAGDRPVKHHADCVDCDRYALMAFAQWPEYEPVTLRSGRRLMTLRRG